MSECLKIENCHLVWYWERPIGERVVVLMIGTMIIGEWHEDGGKEIPGYDPSANASKFCEVKATKRIENERPKLEPMTWKEAKDLFDNLISSGEMYQSECAFKVVMAMLERDRAIREQEKSERDS